MGMNLFVCLTSTSSYGPKPNQVALLAKPNKVSSVLEPNQVTVFAKPNEVVFVPKPKQNVINSQHWDRLVCLSLVQSTSGHMP